MRLRWAGECVACSAELPAGAQARWDSDAKTARCLACATEPRPTEPAVDSDAIPVAEVVIPAELRGTPGASAQREHDKRAARELARKQKAVDEDTEWRKKLVAERPVVGRIATLITPRPTVGPESQATRAWADGAVGELAVGPLLAACAGVEAIHDRRVPNSKANIDHIAVGPAGVFVVDAKNYDGHPEVRDVGGWLRSDERLFVDGRDRTKLVKGMHQQIEVVRKALADEAVPIQGVLCFLGSTRRIFWRPLCVQGVTVVTSDRVDRVVSKPGDIPPRRIRELTLALATKLPPA